MLRALISMVNSAVLAVRAVLAGLHNHAVSVNMPMQQLAVLRAEIVDATHVKTGSHRRFRPFAVLWAPLVRICGGMQPVGLQRSASRRGVS